MKKAPTIFVIIVLTLGLLGLVAIQEIGARISEDRNASILWIQESTEIQIPIHSTFLELYEGMEYGKLLKYQLHQASTDTFIEKYRLSKVSSENAGTLLITDIEHNWDLEKAKKHKDFYLLNDCKKGLSWTLLVERTEGLLWFEVLYADFSGDEPECENE